MGAPVSDEVKRRIVESLSEAADDACDTVKASARGKMMVVRGSTRTHDAWKIINVLLERAAIADDEKIEPMKADELAAARERLRVARKA
jgi:hypothetical protein